jgi:hypothetical protein
MKSREAQMTAIKKELKDEVSGLLRTGEVISDVTIKLMATKHNVSPTKVQKAIEKYNAWGRRKVNEQRDRDIHKAYAQDRSRRG